MKANKNEEKLMRAFEGVVWMAIRYAHGRHTAAPLMVREAIMLVQQVKPDWKPRRDITIKPEPEQIGGWERGDWLDDLMPK